MTTSRVLVAAVAFGALLACSREPSPPAADAVPAEPAPLASSSSALAGSSSAYAALEQMDERAPVPLLPMMAHHQKQNMRDHLVAVGEIVSALAAEDFAGIERAAGRLGYSEQMGRMCSHMGAGAPGFSEQAIAFHHTADGIALAAKKKDRAGVTKALDATLRACTSCHAAWKQELVDEPTWRALTASAPPSSGSH